MKQVHWITHFSSETSSRIYECLWLIHFSAGKKNIYLLWHFWCKNLFFSHFTFFQRFKMRWILLFSYFLIIIWNVWDVQSTGKIKLSARISKFCSIKCNKGNYKYLLKRYSYKSRSQTKLRQQNSVWLLFLFFLGAGE